MKQLRVAMIAPPWLAIPPVGYGGTENVIAALVPGLMVLGVSVELFATGDSRLKANKNHWLYKTGQYEFIHRPYYDTLPIISAHLLFALDSIQRDGGFDIIHNHITPLGPTVTAYAGNHLPPILHTLHGPPFTTQDRLDLDIPDNLPLWRQLGDNHRSYYVGISRALMRRAPRALARQTLRPVHNAVNVADFPFVVKKHDYFITLARFHPDKGQGTAARLCQQDGYKLKMAGMVGDITRPKQVMLELANPASTYRSLIDFRYFSDQVFPHLEDSQIEYVGDLSGERKLQFVSRAKALLFPIQWEEPFGMAAIEALACGTPVIAMARGALPEIIEHGVNGFLAHNNREFRSYMKRIGDIDPALCRQSAEKRFSAPVMARNYLRRYKQVLARVADQH
jgi:glycosyltransferase involved in cell wall biosynthesis